MPQFMKWLSFLLYLLLLVPSVAESQCIATINQFPYREGFENNDGGWVAEGVGSDWAWGSPAKSIITSAASGNKCWITGGLISGPYNSGEASWLKSPCFDFSQLSLPKISMKIFWDTEQQYDGASLQYSFDGGATWITVGTAGASGNCERSGNWYNTTAINYLSPMTTTQQGWSGNTKVGSGSCRGGGGSGKWVDVYHTLPAIGGEPSVQFRFLFGAGNICNNYDGFAVDEIEINNADAAAAAFDYTCIDASSLQFTSTTNNCVDSWYWDFGDPATGTDNNSTAPGFGHRFSRPGTYTVSLTVSGPFINPTTITKSVIIGTGLDNNCGDVWFPSGFTPNGDGLNDGFGPFGGRGALQNYRLRIFNRWGQVIFNSSSPFELWNGRYKNQFLDSGVFTWIAEYNYPGKSLIKKSGTVILIK
jgi:gliding motility-associated-like protein